ncbi:MAG: type II toxin-antitoxin system RelE/ParE family toxin [Gammaproteobacteria bacterium]|nr:type II toxin-antitoxin system RelE/ParE family toxin [Gammaproteobacteria bacterium]MYD00938.1 type II toxin-antitoxin system RelE/ParE family toxin [Gammaproteobacteria bacterium]MYI25032.1 type II toxin-antitoxin system RelE/ParE family toxin [Gammaproteobacteria bacterium]
MPKPAALRERARRDIDEAIEHYLTEAGAKIANQFTDTLQATIQSVSSQPKAGSPRYAHELDMVGLRCRKVGKFPYLIFYVERNTEIDVWRVLHGARDIPRWLRESDE